MAQTIGAWIRRARQQRGLSQHRLAQYAHLSPSTVNRWEREQTRPSIPELEQVLQAMGVSTAERLEALRLLHAPRALATLQQLTRRTPHPSGELNPPLLGDLLRALRLRRGWSIAQLSCALEVSERSVRDWERSHIVPSDEHLHALCYVLQATQEEVAFILTRPLWLAPPSTRPEQEGADAIEMQAEALKQLLWQGATEGMELRLLTLEGQAWWHVRRYPQHGALLQWVYTLCCQWYTLHGRVSQASNYAYRGLHMLERARPFPRNAAWLIMAIAIECAETTEPTEKRLLEAASILHDWLPQFEPWPEYESWFYRGIAEYCAQARRSDEALRAAEHGLQSLQRSDNLAERQHECISRALVLTRIGQPHHAMELLTPPENPLPATQVNYLMTLYEVCHALGRLGQAQDALEQVRQIANDHALQRTLRWIHRTTGE